MPMSYSVSQLLYHPIKSLGAIQTDSFEVASRGPLFDRRIMLVDSNGQFVTQRECPTMALVMVHDTGSVLTLSFKNDHIKLSWPRFSDLTNLIMVNVWDDSVSAQLIDDKSVNMWLSKHLQCDVRLVYMADNEHRQVDLNYSSPGDQTSFSDGFPFLLISQASLDFLSEKVGYELSAKRFRPNIVVKGCEPFEEDTWKKLRIGNIEFDVVKSCSRCVIPSINLETAEKEKSVIRAMVDFRKVVDSIYVGQNLIHNNSGFLKVGQEVTVLK